MKFHRRVILAILALFIVSGCISVIYADRTDDYYRKVKENLDLFREVYREISTKYVDDIDPEEFIRAGIRGMLDTLDPYTIFIDEDNTEDLKIMTSGKYGGLGIVIGLRGEDKILTVIAPMDGTPADRLGIRAGDQIIEIEGTSTKGFNTRQAASLMRGEPGTSVEIKIMRFGVPEAILYTIQREIITVKDVSCFTVLEEDIGYIRLARFSRKAGEELDAALKELKSREIRSLILDLRGNPGGLLEAAVEVCDRFIPEGEIIVSTRGMTTGSNRIIKSIVPPNYGDCPLVVLVDGGSASASEIVAGAIQDLDRGVIIGVGTFGKGLVQSLVTFNNGTELKLTTAKYYTPSGRLIQKIDYFSEDNPVIFGKENEEELGSSEEMYFTSIGRKVYGGGGITPDIVVEELEIPNLVGSLFRESEFFYFANDYLVTSTPADALSDPDLLLKFRNYLGENGFNYQINGQLEIEALEVIAQEKNLGVEFNEYLIKMNEMLDTLKAQDFEDNSEIIERYLRMEFAYRESGSIGRLKASVADDPQMQKAIKILENARLYGDILSVESILDE